MHAAPPDTGTTGQLVQLPVDTYASEDAELTCEMARPAELAGTFIVV